jgi:hypothetical protein
VIKHAVHIEKRVAKIRDKDEREDLQMVAKSYHAHLMTQKNLWTTEEEMLPQGAALAQSRALAAQARETRLAAQAAAPSGGVAEGRSEAVRAKPKVEEKSKFRGGGGEPSKQEVRGPGKVCAGWNARGRSKRHEWRDVASRTRPKLHTLSLPVPSWDGDLMWKVG